MTDEEKQAIEHLTKKMKYHKDNPLGTYVWLTLDEHYVRIILKLVENLQKDIESWKKYCDEQENDITLKNNKICDLEFKIEKQSKEIEELKKYKEGYKLLSLVEEQQHKIEKLINANDNLKKTKRIKNMEYVNQNYVSKDKIKDKIKEYKNMLKTYNKAKDIDRIKAINERILELQELIEGEK